MTEFRENVVAFCRLFGVFERDAVCCGTVSVAQCVLLQTLLEDAQDVGTLAKDTKVTKSAMTRLVDGLENRGLVERARDEEDGRRVFVQLTKAGLWEAERLQTLTQESIDHVFSKIDAKKHKQVEQSVELLREAMESSLDELNCC